MVIFSYFEKLREILNIHYKDNPISDMQARNYLISEAFAWALLIWFRLLAPSFPARSCQIQLSHGDHEALWSTGIKRTRFRHIMAWGINMGSRSSVHEMSMHVSKQEGPEALNRSPEYTGQKSNI